MISKALDTYFPKLVTMPALKQDIMAISTMVTLDAGTVILKQGAYVKVIPLLISGLAKVFKEDEDGHEVLLYYIKPGESCVMSVLSMSRNGSSQVKAIIEEKAEIVVIPVDKVMVIAKKYPKWNEFIYDLFNIKFEELLTVIQILTFSNKDIRLLEYLKKEVVLKKNTVLHTTHQQIAIELGSSREVISRLLKKLENEGAIILKQGSIEVL
ncbi:Crp/Fnr family transcriptional regulator [Dokdonia ponticola]|uniref:Crp/Fnr family transcriptional regulator n=1 Tax=Dokdonia ponticola TaxID=2041041 RepID=A0ABV9HYN5_9FLAO